MDASAISPLAAGDALMGRYLLQHELTSTHPWSYRWLASDRILRRPVEVHLLIGPHVDDAIDAARRAALVRDPRLVRIIDAGRYGATAFVLTEPLRGQGLSDFAPLAPDLARCVAGEVASTLVNANARRVYHQTLRPELIYLGQDPPLMIGGLGWDAALWGQVAASPVEAVRKEARDVVAILYCALTGHWPGKTPSFMPRPPQTKAGPIPPSDLSTEVPRDLDVLCAASLDPDSTGPADLDEVIGDLGEWIGRQDQPPLPLDDPLVLPDPLSPTLDGPLRLPAQESSWPLTATGPMPLIPVTGLSAHETELLPRQAAGPVPPGAQTPAPPPRAPRPAVPTSTRPSLTPMAALPSHRPVNRNLSQRNRTGFDQVIYGATGSAESIDPAPNRLGIPSAFWYLLVLAVVAGLWLIWQAGLIRSGTTQGALYLAPLIHPVIRANATQPNHPVILPVTQPNHPVILPVTQPNHPVILPVTQPNHPVMLRETQWSRSIHPSGIAEATIAHPDISHPPTQGPLE